MTLFLGTTERDGAMVSIEEAVRRKHLFLCGKSGTGKSTALFNMAFADLHSGVGFTVVDPHGELCHSLAGVVPRERTNDVIVLDPAHTGRVIGINILESVGESERHLVVSSVISIVKNLWPANWGPRSEYILEHCLYALLESPEPVTLAALPKLLTDRAYRSSIVGHVSDPAVLEFFRFFEAQNDRLRDESIAPLLNKVSKFVTNPLLRAVIGQTTSSISFRRLMDEQKILLCNLSKGALGEDVSSLLGSLIVTKLALASLSRQDIPESDRRLHVLYADEVQNFGLGIDFPTVLAESRKYALSLVLGTQTLAGLPERTVKAIFGNAATLVSFRVSGEDAEALVCEFGTSGHGPLNIDSVIVPAVELQSLPDYTAYLRTLAGGMPQDPLKVRMFPPFSKDGHGRLHQSIRRERTIRGSLIRFGRDRVTVDVELKRFLKAA